MNFCCGKSFVLNFVNLSTDLLLDFRFNDLIDAFNNLFLPVDLRVHLFKIFKAEYLLTAHLLRLTIPYNRRNVVIYET